MIPSPGQGGAHDEDGEERLPEPGEAHAKEDGGGAGHHRTRRGEHSTVAGGAEGEAQGQGLASRLLGVVRELASSTQANLFVTSLEESCPYWMQQGFVLEEGPISKRLNSFPDTHLLKLPSNRPDAYEPGPEDEDEDEDEEGEEGEEEDEEGDDDDEELQQALLRSLE